MTLKASIWILVIVTAICYFNSLWNPFIWDDEQFIQKNSYIQQIQYWPQLFTSNTIEGAGHLSNYYRPLTSLSFGIDYLIWGLNPIGFHLTNTILHILAGIGLLLLLRSLKLPPLVAFWVSLIFLVHPLQTEAVTYINSRGDSLYSFWLIWSVWLFSMALQRRSLTVYRSKINYSWLYLLSIVSYLASLLSKEIALAGLSLYCLVLIALCWPLTFKKLKTGVLHIGLISGLTAGYFGLRLTVLNFQNILNYTGETNLYTDSLVVRLLTFSKVVWTYLSLLFWPYPLHMERDSQIISQLANPWTLGLIGLLLLLGLLAFYEWRKYWTVWIGFGFSWFVSLLIPTSGIIPINGLVYEHWLYLPMVGFWLIIWRLSSLIPLKIPPKLITILLTLAVSILGVLTIYQNYLWSSHIIFYEYTLQFNQSARLHNNLAMAYSDQQDYPKAEQHYLKAIEINAQYPQTYFNLANLYFNQQKYDLAETNYLKSLEVDPSFYFTYPRLINLYYQTKQYDRALPHLEAVIKLTPNDYQLELVYGQTLLKLQRLDQAQTHFDRALQLTDHHPQIELEIQNIRQNIQD